MTRDEHRAKCVEAMIADYLVVFKNLWPGSRPTRLEAIQLMTAAFDALHGIARVNPIEATREMVASGEREIFSDYQENATWDEAKDVIENLDLLKLFRAMSTAGDLTNVPEKPHGDEK